MIQIKWFARGGQGGFTACRLMALAAAEETGSYVQAFPSFGPERRGAPVFGFTRIDQRPIRDHSQIYDYDYAIVIDPTLLETQDVMAGLAPGGTAFINSERTPEELGLKGGKVVTFNADAISEAILGARISNTAMMAMAAVHTGLAGEESLKKACEVLLPPRILKGNRQVVEAVCRQKGGSAE